MEKTAPPLHFTLLTVLVATLGYFVDVYDIWIFAATRATSLKDLGLTDTQLLDSGILLLNAQMVGMLCGGLVFGILGDKYGRTRVMFLSILTYSIATLANGFITNVPSYAILRFLSGFGLAGELGLGATLVAETLSKEKRGLGIGALIGVGVTGAIFAGLAAQMFSWRTCYIIGGTMGLLLLLMRMRVLESFMFKGMGSDIKKGSLLMLVRNPARLKRFLWCLTLGMPTWYVAGIFTTFSTEIGISAGFAPIATAVLMVYCNSVMPLGDLTGAWLSNTLKSRKKAYGALAAVSALCALILLLSPLKLGETAVITLYAIMSFGSGTWVLMTVMSSEVFGTNLRATVTTAVPNFARGSVIPMTLALSSLKSIMPIADAVLMIGLVVFTLPLLAMRFLPESFGTDLDYVEKDA